MDRRVRTSLISIGTGIFLTAVKGALAFLSGSLAILADAYHSFSNLIASCTALIAVLLKLRSKHRGDSFAPTPLSPGAGHPPPPREGAIPGSWIESEIVYLISLVIAWMAYDMISTVMAAPPEEIRNIWVAEIGIADCVAIAYLISRFKIMVGRETGSTALVADGYHTRMDMFTSAVVLLSITGEWIGIELDRIAAISIAVVIAITGINLFVCSFVSSFRRSPVEAGVLWGLVFSFITWIMSTLSQYIFTRKIPVPAFDFAGLHPRAWLSRSLATGLVLLLAAAYVGSGITIVQPDETGVRFRFGAIIDSELNPGLHCALRPFEKIVKVNVQRVYRVEVGFRTDPALLIKGSGLFWERKHQVPGYEMKFEEATVLTGNATLTHLSLVVHYRPLDAVTHLFRVSKLREVMRGLTETCMREVLASESSELVMTWNRRRVLERMKEKLTDEVDKVGLGVEVLAVLCHDVHPPLETLTAFREVFSAREDHVRYLNEAESYRGQELHRTHAKGFQWLADASAYAIERGVRAEGDARKFLLTAEAYQDAPEITSYRLFVETIERGLTNKEKYIADPLANLGGYRLWLFKPPPPPKRAFEPSGTPIEE